MKQVLFIGFLSFLIFNSSSLAQEYFKDTWIGYKSGVYNNGRFPHVADIGDLNNDGNTDIVIGQFALDPGFKVVFGYGDGTFSGSTHYTTLEGIESIKIGDINNDGHNDIILTNSGTFSGFGDDPQSWEYGNSISIFVNNGDGTFQNHSEVITALHPRGLAVADFDNDGDLDIAVANFGRPATPGNTVSIIENDGSGNFTVKQTITMDNFPFRISAGRINNDNLVDLFVGHESSVRTVLINNGNGFNPPVPFGGIRPSGYSLGTNMDLFDLDNDNDNDNDLIFYDSWGGSTDRINIYRNDGNGNYSTFETYFYPAWLGSGDHCEYPDINNDGWPDIISASFNGQSGKGFYIFESDGSGGFLPVVTYSSGMASSAAFGIDADKDGINDIVTVDYSMSVNVHLNLGDGSFPVNKYYEISGGSEDLDAGDIDLDGDIDIITSSDDGFESDISVLLNNGDGTFAPHFLITRTGNDQGGAHAKLRDMDGDGYPDVLFVSPVTNLSYVAFIAFNNGNGGFNYPVTLQVSGCGWGDIDAIDLDNDGDLDIVISEFLACTSISESGKRIFILKNNGNGTFEPPYTKVIGPNPRTMTTGDYNLDGKVDVVTANWGPYGYRNFIQILLGDGAGNFSEPITKITGTGPHHIVTSDFNNDGIPDLASANTGTDGIGVETMSVIINNGDGTFQNSVTYDAPYSSLLLGTSGITAGDIDHDGDNDILVANSAGSDLAVYLNDGNGNFEHLYRAGVQGYGVRGLAYEDFTGDNTRDVAAITAPAIGSIVINHVNILEGIEDMLTGSGNVNPELADNFYLEQNYPNPFNPVTRISWKSNARNLQTLIVYDMLGREIKTLFNKVTDAGSYSVEFNAAGLPSGIYFYRLQSGNFVESRKMILLK